MILLAATIPIKPEMREDAVRAVTEMVEATVKEAGCLKYDFYSSITDPNRFMAFEEWESDEALAAHMQTPHMAELRRRMPELAAGPMSVRRYVVESAASL
jgi:quinol monooxygenase YgiN